MIRSYFLCAVLRMCRNAGRRIAQKLAVTRSEALGALGFLGMFTIPGSSILGPVALAIFLPGEPSESTKDRAVFATLVLAAGVVAISGVLTLLVTQTRFKMTPESLFVGAFFINVISVVVQIGLLVCGAILWSGAMAIPDA